MANLSVEEPYALMWARTGLWEPWVGNDPRPPGPEKFEVAPKTHCVGITGFLLMGMEAITGRSIRI